MLLDCEEKFNYDNFTMTETVTAPPQVEATTAPVSRERVERTVKKMVATEAKKREGTPATTDADMALDQYRKIQTLKNGDTMTFDKADPANPKDRDLLLPGFKIADDDGNSVTFKNNEWRVAEITGVDDGGNLQCVIENVVDPDKHGQATAAVDRQWVLDGQLLAQQEQFAEAFSADPDAQDAFKYWAASHPQSEGKIPLPDNAPTEDTLAKLDKNYNAPDDEADTDPAAPETSEAVTRAREVIAKEIKKIEDVLKDPDLSKDKREQAQAILLALRVAKLTESGSVGMAFTIDALKLIEGSEALVGELQGDAMAAEIELSNMLRDAAKDKQFDKWKDLVEDPGNMAKLLKDKQFTKLLADEKGGVLCEALFGKDLNADQLKDMFSNIDGIPDELKKALKSGDRSGILMLLLQILAGVVLAPVAVSAAVGVGGVATALKTMDAFGGQR